ncbi:hypothetical protein BD770DRAFT_177934 [Pilaira anomala]|nr:hypothetical protein BD770DRAFT_177934 [Pilaira anomala]
MYLSSKFKNKINGILVKICIGSYFTNIIYQQDTYSAKKKIYFELVRLNLVCWHTFFFFLLRNNNNDRRVYIYKQKLFYRDFKLSAIKIHSSF